MAPFASKLLLLPGILLLIHACYSAWEHSALTARAPNVTRIKASPLPATVNAEYLPLDISLETIVSIVLICTGLVLGAEDLKPISWRVWAGNIERESGGGGPYQGLEERMSFIDIRQKRREFANWVKEKGDTK